MTECVIDYCRLVHKTSQFRFWLVSYLHLTELPPGVIFTYPLELLRIALLRRRDPQPIRDTDHPTFHTRSLLKLYHASQPVLSASSYTQALGHLCTTLTVSPDYSRSCATSLADLDIGALAGTVAQIVSYPFEVVRWRMQVAYGSKVTTATLPIHSERGPVVQNRNHPDPATVTEHALLTTPQVDAEAAPASGATSLTLTSTPPPRLRLAPLPTTATVAPIEGSIPDNLPPSDSGANFRPNNQDLKQYSPTQVPATYRSNVRRLPRRRKGSPMTGTRASQKTEALQKPSFALRREFYQLGHTLSTPSTITIVTTESSSRGARTNNKPEDKASPPT
ncbi:hypothetical protein EDB85DRAFT_1885976 [Lactarius pseudohatsudake]|nr:hypothetical protein EDB85DRAFT_1885976 [Lactarius pseudohatsudake]